MNRLDEAEHGQLTELTAEIVSAYLSHNTIAASQVGDLISSVHDALAASAGGTAEPEPEPLKPAVPIRKSVTPDYIVCLEDGKRFKSMRRHLANAYGMTPDEYRAKWGLPRDYPMTAPSYAEKRSALAKQMGLGRKSQAPTLAQRRAAGRKQARQQPAQQQAQDNQPAEA